MLALLLESAARSLALGGVVWLGLKFLRVRSPHDEMTAWRLVLATSLAMPLLVQLLAPWATVTIPTSVPLAQIVIPEAVKIDRIAPATSSQAPGPTNQPLTEDTLTSAPAEPAARESARGTGWSIGWQGWITAIYVLVGGTMLLRMLLGIVLGFRLVRMARSLVEPWSAGCDVRISNAVSAPVTFGSTILLPPDCIDWGAAKRQAVLSHEKSHIDQNDLAVLMLASLHRAVYWFNPLSWWLVRRLTELAEIISDDAAVAVLRDPHAYAAILLDIASSGRPAATGVAMARPHTVRRRIERLLAATAPMAPITHRRHLLLALALLPAVAVAAIGIATGAPPPQVVAEAQITPFAGRADAGPAVEASEFEEQQKKLREELRHRAEELRRRLQQQGQPAPPMRTDQPAAPITLDQRTPPTCATFMARLHDAGRALSLPTLPSPRIEGARNHDVANSIDKVTYDWPNNAAQIGELSCFNREFVLYRMQVDTAALRRPKDEPRSSRDLHVIRAAIFAFTGTPPSAAMVQLLLAQQPRQPNERDATLPLPSDHMVWLEYDSFAINWLRRGGLGLNTQLL